MEFKNVIFAIVLSFAVLLSWSLFFETPQVEKQNENQQTEIVKKNNTTSSDVPTVDTKNGAQAISRENSIKGSERFYFENKNVNGIFHSNMINIQINGKIQKSGFLKQ